jgi:hypothetical protein
MRMYMVTIDFPKFVTEEFLKLVPAQRRKIAELLANGKLASFSLNLDRSNAWLVIHGKSKADVVALLEQFPMHEYFTYKIDGLMVYDTEFMGLPKLAMN